MPNTSDKMWYVLKGIKRLGPFSNAEMRGLANSGKLVPEDMIWKDGLDGWVKASKLKGVFQVEQGVFQVEPEIQEVSPPPIESEPETLSQNSNKSKGSGCFTTALNGYIFAILSIIVIGLFQPIFSEIVHFIRQNKSSVSSISKTNNTGAVGQKKSPNSEKEEIPNSNSATPIAEIKPTLPTEPKIKPPVVLLPASKVEEKAVEISDSYEETLGHLARERLSKVPPIPDIELVQTQDVIEFSEKKFTKDYNGPFLNKVIKINDVLIDKYSLDRATEEGFYLLTFKAGVEEINVGSIYTLYRRDEKIIFCMDTEDALSLLRMKEVFYKRKTMHCDLYFKIVNRKSKRIEGYNFLAAKLVWLNYSREPGYMRKSDMSK
jgi:hypothetical protein